METRYKVVMLPTNEASTLHVQDNVLQTGILRSISDKKVQEAQSIVDKLEQFLTLKTLQLQ
jgi:hypothetical protein